MRKGYPRTDTDAFLKTLDHAYRSMSSYQKKVNGQISWNCGSFFSSLLLHMMTGGNIAMIFAIRYPDRVNRLILNGANLNPMGVKRSTQIPIEIGYKFAKKYAEKSDSARLNAEMLGLMVNDPNVEPEELVKIKAKTLVIAGTKDMIKKEHTRLIASHIPDSELVFLKGNHFIASKHPDEFNRAVLQFLRS